MFLMGDMGCAEPHFTSSQVGQIDCTQGHPELWEVWRIRNRQDAKYAKRTPRFFMV